MPSSRTRRATTGLGSPPGRAAKLEELIGAQVAIHELDGPVLSGDQKPQKGGRLMVVLYRRLRFSASDRHKVVHPGESVQPLWPVGPSALQTPQGRSLDSFVIEEGVRS